MSTFGRVYLYGIALLVLVTLTLGGMGAVLSKVPPPVFQAIDLAESLQARAPEVLDNPAELEVELSQMAERLGGELAVYRFDGTLVAASSAPPIPPLYGPPLETVRHGKLFRGNARKLRFPFGVGLPAERPQAYLTAVIPMWAPILSRMAIFLASVLGVLALAAIPFARLISAPITQLTRSARALGEGDLSARSGIVRRDEVGVLAAAFDEMAGRLEQLIRGEKELIANVSHELRTPLTRIRFALELAEEGDAEKARRALADVRIDLAELEVLVSDILTTARLDLAAVRPGEGQGVPALRREPVEVPALVGQVVDRFRGRHPARTVETAIDAGLPALALDPVLIRRALDNVLDNARKYSDEAQPIHLSVRREADGVALEVRDQGIGIDPGDLPRLFTPFFRTDRSRARGTGGVGLGLALAKRILEAHGGTIAARSAPGEGTVIRLVLPGNAAVSSLG